MSSGIESKAPLRFNRRGEDLVDGLPDRFDGDPCALNPVKVLEVQRGSRWVSRKRRRFTNARMITIFTVIAGSLLRTEESMAMPCSVKTNGG